MSAAAGGRQLQRGYRGGDGLMRQPGMFGDFETFFDLVDPLLTGRMSHPAFENTKMRSVPIDITESEEAYQIKADLPGVAQDNITLEVDGDTISLGVKEERVSESAPDSDAGSGEEDAAGAEDAGAGASKRQAAKVHRRERSSSFVRRSVRMPEAADMEQVAASYKDGVLTLNVPKREQAVARRRQIAINAS